jgi:hypothetical protein
MSLEQAIEEIVERTVRRVLREEFRPELLTPAQAGELVGRSSKTICAWMREGKLQRHGEGKPLVSRAELLSLCGPSAKRARPAGKAPSAEAEVHRLMRRHG